MTNTPHKVYLGEDLTETQIYITLQTFDKCASEYANKWEWNPKTVKEINKYNIDPFSKYIKNGQTCLIAGCQSGRDYSLLSKAGLKCLGVNPSFGQLSEANLRVQNGIFMHSDLRGLPFLPDSFDLIYADAVTTVPRKDIGDLLKDFNIFLKNNGVIYLSFKVGKESVLVMDDLQGKRYLCIFEKEKILKLVKSAGFEIVWTTESSHTDPKLPKWLSLVAMKKK